MKPALRGCSTWLGSGFGPGIRGACARAAALLIGLAWFLALGLVPCPGLGCPASAQEVEDGFTPLFNGRDLTGWDGEPGWWRVADGTITAESTPEKPCTRATYLIYTGETPPDFELRLEFRLVGGNSGVQFRSQRWPQWDTFGYQADLDDAGEWTGCLFEHARGGVAMRGQEVEIAEDGTKTTRVLGDSQRLLAAVRPHDWNEYRVVARGPELTLAINGTTMCRAIDRDRTQAARSGILALQMHPGPPMKVEFRKIRIQPLDPATPKPTTP